MIDKTPDMGHVDEFVTEMWDDLGIEVRNTDRYGVVTLRDSRTGATKPVGAYEFEAMAALARTYLPIEDEGDES